MQRKVGGIFLLTLNTATNPIANKYREGKLKRTLKRELIVPETAAKESGGGLIVLSSYTFALLNAVLRSIRTGNSLHRRIF